MRECSLLSPPRTILIQLFALEEHNSEEEGPIKHSGPLGVEKYHRKVVTFVTTLLMVDLSLLAFMTTCLHKSI